LIEIRNLVPSSTGSDQNQDRVPFRQMTEAVGHAVRANYLYAGVADVFAESGDASLLKTITAISDDVATQKLTITGMTGALYDGASPDGSTRHGSIKTVHQAYGRDYQLPNLTAYNETCATVGYAMWVWRMLEITGDARYADLLEQSLYNGVLPGISLEGKHYFYVNPLKKLNDFAWPMRWSRTRTPNIKSSFCCPPNVVRTIAEAHNYVYSLSTDALWVHLYGASTLDTAWLDGSRIKLRQETGYPWNGTVKFTIDAAPDRPMALKLRIPGWLHTEAATVRINGEHVSRGMVVPPMLGNHGQDARATPQPGTYFEIKRTWKAGDVIELRMEFSPTLWEANPLVEETLGQVALRYGPLVYCAESNDLPPETRLTDIALAVGANPSHFMTYHETIANAEVLMITLSARAMASRPWSASQLYREVQPRADREITLKLVPYFAWGNRGDTEMTVWLPVR
jgi:DUF1680 family protein